MSQQLVDYHGSGEEYVVRDGALDSYRTNHVTFRLGTTRLRLEPCDRPAEEFPFDARVFIVSAWNPNRFPASGPQNARYTKELTTALEQHGARVLPAATHAPDRSWMERSLIVRGLARSTVAILGARFGSPAMLAWDSESLSVVTLSRFIEETSNSWALREVAAPCPMLVEPEPATVCQRPGGGWTGASMNAALQFQVHRGYALELFGCDSCAAGAVPSDAPGQAIGLVNHSCSSRWSRMLPLGYTEEVAGTDR